MKWTKRAAARRPEDKYELGYFISTALVSTVVVVRLWVWWMDPINLIIH